MSPIRKKVSKGIHDPKKITVFLRRLIGKRENRMSGVDVMSEDWDNLLILDACRYDMFERLNTISGTLESRRSKGSATREFVENNFADRTLHDTVYVTANPYVSLDTDEDVFHAIVHLWRTEWDDVVGTVRPETVAQAVRDAAEQYPNKRIVGHFVQPHHPFIGPFGREQVSERLGNELARREALGDEPTEARGDDRVWTMVEDGQVDLDTVVKAYDENLELVLPIVANLVESLTGKTVVTSDHGNLLDEPAYPIVSVGSRRYAHPRFATAEPLVKVPWLICPHEQRRSITADPPTQSDLGKKEDDDVVSERLAALGYTDE